MKKLLAGVAFCAVASTAQADTRYAEITRVDPNWVTVTQNIPTTECYNVEVPIYGNAGGGASAGDVLGGMIIGGLIGKGVTNKDNGAAAGAVLGGMIAADKKNNRQAIVGYKQEQRCEKRFTTEQSQQIKNYTIWYSWNGIQGRSYTYNKYNVGDQIPISVSINAN